MIYPSIDELSQGGKYNRYTLVIAASKCARMVTDEYVAQREVAEKLLANKETDKSLASMIKREFRDEKAVKSAIKRLYQGEYRIADRSLDPEYQEKVIEEREAKEKAEAERRASRIIIDTLSADLLDDRDDVIDEPDDVLDDDLFADDNITDDIADDLLLDSAADIAIDADADEGADIVDAADIIDDVLDAASASDEI